VRCLFCHYAQTLPGAEERKQLRLLFFLPSLSPSGINMPVGLLDLPYEIHGRILSLAQHDTCFGQTARARRAELPLVHDCWRGPAQDLRWSDVTIKSNSEADALLSSLSGSKEVMETLEIRGNLTVEPFPQRTTEGLSFHRVLELLGVYKAVEHLVLKCVELPTHEMWSHPALNGSSCLSCVVTSP